MSIQEARACKLKYTLKVMAGVAFLAFAVWLSYWLIFEYKVRNALGLIAIVMFLVIPSILSALTIPREIVGLILVWKNADPKGVERLLEHFRENDPK